MRFAQAARVGSCCSEHTAVGLRQLDPSVCAETEPCSSHDWSDQAGVHVLFVWDQAQVPRVLRCESLFNKASGVVRFRAVWGSAPGGRTANPQAPLFVVRWFDLLTHCHRLCHTVDFATAVHGI